MGTGDVSFDKVFAVPQAPGNMNSIDTNNDGIDGQGQDKSAESSDISVDDPKEGIYDLWRPWWTIHNELFDYYMSDAIVYRNGNNGNTITKSESLEDDLQRAISTAERRKVNVIQISITNTNPIREWKERKY